VHETIHPTAIVRLFDEDLNEMKVPMMNSGHTPSP
jgi:hypothetical protein